MILLLLMLLMLLILQLVILLLLLLQRLLELLLTVCRRWRPGWVTVSSRSERRRSRVARLAVGRTLRQRVQHAATRRLALTRSSGSSGGLAVRRLAWVHRRIRGRFGLLLTGNTVTILSISCAIVVSATSCRNSGTRRRPNRHRGALASCALLQQLLLLLLLLHLLVLVLLKKKLLLLLQSQLLEVFLHQLLLRVFHGTRPRGRRCGRNSIDSAVCVTARVAIVR